MKYFFWIAFAVFLAASIPHVAYFFAAFEPSTGPEGVWWWAVSYAIAISIDVTVYLLSWTAFQRYRKYRSAKAVWQHWLLIVICTFFSWAVNWAYAKQFHSAVMLSSAEAAAPWLVNVFPFMASAFPLLGIVYTMMAETISETSEEDKKHLPDHQLQALAELAKQTQLPIATLRQALTSGNQQTSTKLIETITNRVSAGAEEEPRKASSEAEQAITGQFVALETELPSTGKQKAATSSFAEIPGDGNADKLQMTLQALRANPAMTDEALAERLSLKRPASARFWRLKAIEILNASDIDKASKATPSVQSSWATTEALANGSGAKR